MRAFKSMPTTSEVAMFSVDPLSNNTKTIFLEGNSI